MSHNGFQSVLRAARSLLPPSLLAPALLAAAIAGPARAGEDGAVLAAAQDRGYVRCGVHRSGVGLAEIRADGVWAGYFVEFCRVVALGALGDSAAIRVYEVDDLSASLALADDLVDVVLSAVSPQQGAAEDGIAYLSPLLEDEQMLVSFLDGIGSMGGLPPRARICASAHPTVQANLGRALGDRSGAVTVLRYASIDGLFNAFFRLRCDALSHHHYAILAQSLLRSPQRSPMWRSVFGLGAIRFVPAVETGDPAWAALVDAAVRSALHDPVMAPEAIPESVREGFAARVQSIANSRTAIFDRTLGHMGGQGFYPAPAGGAQG